MLILAGAVFIGAGTAGQAIAAGVQLPSGPVLYTINETGVSMIDSSNGKLMAFTPYPPKPDLNRHYEAVLSPDGSALFVLCEYIWPDKSGNYHILVMNTSDRTFSSIDITHKNDLFWDERFPSENMHIAMSDDGSRLFVIRYVQDRHSFYPGTLDLLRVTTLCAYDRVNGEYVLDREIKMPGMSMMVACSPDGSKAYVVYATMATGNKFNDDQLLVIDFTTEETTTVPVHPCVHDIAISPDGSHLYLAICMAHSWLTIYEVGDVNLGTYQTNYFTDRVCFPEEIEVSTDGTSLYVIGTELTEDIWTQSPQNDVLEYFQSNLLGANIYTTIPLHSEALKMSPDGKYAYIRSPGKVARYDVTRSSTYSAPSLHEQQSYGSTNDFAPSWTYAAYSVTVPDTATPTPVAHMVIPIKVNTSKIPPVLRPSPSNGTATLPSGLAPGFTAGARYLGAINLTGSGSATTGTVTPVPSAGAVPIPGIIRRPLRDLTTINDSSGTAAGTNDTTPAATPTIPAGSSVAPSPVPSQAGDGLPNVVISVIALIISVSFLAMRVKR